MDIFFGTTLIIGLIIANELLPVACKDELPRSSHGSVRSVSFLTSLLTPKRETQLQKDNENLPFRRSYNDFPKSKIYLIALNPKTDTPKSEKDPVKILKLLGKKLLQPTESPVKKNLEMLPFEKLFDQNDYLYLTRPKEKRVKKMLRGSERFEDSLNKKSLREDIDKSKMVYQFSDLVL